MLGRLIPSFIGKVSVQYISYVIKSLLILDLAVQWAVFVHLYKKMSVNDLLPIGLLNPE